MSVNIHSPHCSMARSLRRVVYGAALALAALLLWFSLNITVLDPLEPSTSFAAAADSPALDDAGTGSHGGLAGAATRTQRVDVHPAAVLTAIPTSSDVMLPLQRVQLARGVALAVLQATKDPEAAWEAVKTSRQLQLPSPVQVPRNPDAPWNLYYFVTINCGKPLLVTRFHLQHYRDGMDIEPDKMHALLHVAGADAAQRKACVDLVHGRGLWYTLWDETFSIARKHELGLQAEIALGVRQRVDWVMHVDADDFHEYPKGGVRKIIDGAIHNQVALLTGVFVDRISMTGHLTAVQSDIPIPLQFPVACNFTRVVGRAEVDKMMVWRAFLHSEDGGWHHVDAYNREFWGNKSVGPYRVHHYKWTDGVYQNLEEREALRRQLHQLDWVNQTSLFLTYFNEHQNRIDVKDQNLQCIPAEKLTPLPIVRMMLATKRFKMITKPDWDPPSMPPGIDIPATLATFRKALTG